MEECLLSVGNCGLLRGCRFPTLVHEEEHEQEEGRRKSSNALGLVSSHSAQPVGVVLCRLHHIGGHNPGSSHDTEPSH